MRVLLAEDEKTTRVRLQSYLKRWGYDIVAVENGKLALEEFEKQEFQIVITDWEMPEMDGLELVKRIRDSFISSYVYILLLTSRAEKQDIVDGMEGGADDFLTKPFDRNELRVRIRAGERIIKLEKSLAEQNHHLEEANVRLASANERMMQDLDAAADIQKAFLPNDLPNCPGARFSWTFLPCDELAGDTLNIVPLDDHNIALFVLDVSGHGVPAALLSVSLSRMLSGNDPSSVLKERSVDSAEYRIVSPKDVVRRLGERFVDDDTEQYFTIIYGVLNTQTRELRVVGAGHPGPVLVRSGQAAEFIDITGVPIGLLGDEVVDDYDEVSLQLGLGDRIYFYSDGVPETADDTNDLFDTDGILSVCDEFRNETLDETISSLLEGLESWRNGSPVTDDISVLGVELI
jgi:sigma-B regulation protein RsbU (phosphoserine phosphatase)